MQKDEIIFRKFLAAYRAGNTDKMSEIIKAGLEKDPWLLKTWLERAKDHGYFGQYGAADEYLSVLDLLTGADAPILLIRAYNSWLQGDNESTIKFCQRVLEKTPDHGAAHSYMAEAQYEMGLFEESLKSYDNAFQSCDGNAHLWCGRGMVLRAMGREKEALDCFEKTLALDPGIAAWNLATARSRIGLKLFREALLFLDRALAADATLKEAWFDKGNVLINMCRYEEAKPCFIECLKFDDKNADAWMNAGYLCYLEGEYEKALDNFERCLELNPESDEVMNYIGVTLGKMGLLQDSLYFLEEALERNPRNAEALANRSMTLAAMEGK